MRAFDRWHILNPDSSDQYLASYYCNPISGTKKKHPSMTTSNGLIALSTYQRHPPAGVEGLS
jgi:hypothetical protein